MNQDVPQLSQDLMLTCTDQWGREVDVPTTLSYRREDPYALTLAFHANGGDVTWIVSRTLVLQGLATPVGDGDVRVRPGRGGVQPTAILEFTSPDGSLVARARTQELQAFLARTFAVVPVGSESAHVDIDGLLTALLDAA